MLMRSFLEELELLYSTKDYEPVKGKTEKKQVKINLVFLQLGVSCQNQIGIPVPHIRRAIGFKPFPEVPIA